jgi:hypothetical protein
MTRKRPVRKMSKAMAAKLREYRLQKLAYLVAARCRHVLCPVFPEQPVVDVHHTRGRSGRLLLMEEFWIAVSRRGHRWIHDHPAEARRAGLLCALGEWNTMPKDKS